MVISALVIRIVERRSRSVIRSNRYDQKGRRLSGETGVKQANFQVFSEGCDSGIISYLEGEGVPKNRGIVTERILKSVCLICELYSQRWRCEGT